MLLKFFLFWEECAWRRKSTLGFICRISQFKEDGAGCVCVVGCTQLWYLGGRVRRIRSSRPSMGHVVSSRLAWPIWDHKQPQKWKHMWALDPWTIFRWVLKLLRGFSSVNLSIFSSFLTVWSMSCPFVAAFLLKTRNHVSLVWRSQMLMGEWAGKAC